MMKEMGARVELKPKESSMDMNGNCSRTSLQNAKALWKTHSIHLRDLEKTKEQVQSATLRVGTGPYFQISSPTLRLIGHVSSSNLKFIQRIIRFQATDLAAVKGFASLWWKPGCRHLLDYHLLASLIPNRKWCHQQNWRKRKKWYVSSINTK